MPAVIRIRNGKNGWRGTVNGAAAIATGKNSSLCGAIAAVFHLCKDKNWHVDAIDFKSKYHLLVFSPSGYLIQYALRVSRGLDTEACMTGASTAYESAPGSDSELIIEAMQKWNICQKRWKQEDDFDIYGENGSSDVNKVFNEAIRKGNTTSAVSKYTSTRSKISPEERHHFYISEVELQMHGQVALWARSEIYFGLMMMTEGIKLDGGDAGGEIEIEKIPTHMREPKSKNLVLVSYYLDNPTSQLARIPASDTRFGSQALADAGGLSSGGNSSALGSMTESCEGLRGGISF